MPKHTTNDNFDSNHFTIDSNGVVQHRTLFTQAEKDKLGNITSSFKGLFADSTTRDGAISSPVSGDFCIQQDTDTVWFYNGTAWANTGASSTGDMLKAIYDPTNIASSPFDRSNHTGFQEISTVLGLQSNLDARLIGGFASPPAEAKVAVVGTSGAIGYLNLNAVDANRLSGVTSDVQTQIDSKLSVNTDTDRVLMIGNTAGVISNSDSCTKQGLVSIMSNITTDDNNVEIDNINTNKVTSHEVNLFLENSTGKSIYLSGGGNFRPVEENQDLGSSTERWDIVYYNTLDASSDERLKDFIDFPTELLDSWLKHVDFKSYTYKKGGLKRVGIVAQDIIKAFDEANLNWKEWNIVKEDENGMLSVDYNEVSIIEMASTRHILNKIK